MLNKILIKFKDKDYEDTEAKEFEVMIMKELLKKGMEVKRQVWVNNRYDGRRGRIDLVAYFEGKVIAIEIDRKNARQKSIFKLNQIDTPYRFVITRSPFKIIEI